LPEEKERKTQNEMGNGGGKSDEAEEFQQLQMHYNGKYGEK